MLLLQVVQILHQRGPVVEGFGLLQPEIGLDAAVRVVEGAVFDDGDLLVARDLEERSRSGGAGLHHAGAAAGGLSDQRDPAGAAEGRGHQVAAGEGVVAGQAVQPVAIGHVVLIVVLAVQVDVGQIDGVGLGAGKGIAPRDVRLPQEPGDHEDRRVRVAAAVVAQVEHDVLDGAALALDLAVGVDDQVDGILGIVAVDQHVVVVRAIRLEMIEGDEGGVAHLFIAGHPGAIDRLARVLVDRSQLERLANRRPKVRHADDAFNTGVAVEQIAAPGNYTHYIGKKQYSTIKNMDYTLSLLIILMRQHFPLIILQLSSIIFAESAQPAL